MKPLRNLPCVAASWWFEEASFTTAWRCQRFPDSFAGDARALRGVGEQLVQTGQGLVNGATTGPGAILTPPLNTADSLVAEGASLVAAAGELALQSMRIDGIGLTCAEMVHHAARCWAEAGCLLCSFMHVHGMHVRHTTVAPSSSSGHFTA